MSRFCSRLAAYELTAGEGLLHQCFIEMAESMRGYMEISHAIERMESMMIGYPVGRPAAETHR